MEKIQLKILKKGIEKHLFNL